MSPLPRAVARANRVGFNRLLRLVAPRLPGLALLTHRGRRSGRAYTVPVSVFRAGPGYRIALFYGRDADWVRNVLAAGGCTVVIRGRRHELVAPRLVHDPDRRWAPPVVRQVLGIVRAPDSLVLAERRPGDDPSS